jgi:hypothetical protein
VRDLTWWRVGIEIPGPDALPDRLINNRFITPEAKGPPRKTSSDLKRFSFGILVALALVFRLVVEITRYAYDNAGDLRAMALREKESGRLSLVLE